jgi:pre-mRNA-processing factor 39
MMLENGHPGVEVDEAAIRRGENPYTKYFQQQGENPTATAAANGQVSRLTPEASAMRI